MSPGSPQAGHSVTTRPATCDPRPGRGQVTVAEALLGPDGERSVSPAVPLLHRALTDAGLTVLTGTVHTDPPPAASDGATTALVAEAPDEHTPPLALAVDADDQDADRAAREALASVASVRGARTVFLASPRSFCAGVERAIDVVDQLLEQNDTGDPVYVRKQIVHNTHVVNDLAQRGAVFVDELDEVPDGATVVFSAHGVSPQVRNDARHKELRVVDATCPLVTKVHTEARRFAEQGNTVVLIGHAGHEEVEGTVGEAPDRTVLVENISDVEHLTVPDSDRVAFLTQTTLSVEETAGTVRALKSRFPKVQSAPSDDICYATTNRQNAVAEVAARSDLVLVVGSTNSSNSVRLVELSERQGVPAHLVDDARDIRPSWLAGVRSVGLSAGASAPPSLVTEVIATLSGLGPVDVVECTTTVENVYFAPPRSVRKP
ncbi:4-hydroxy-3-methylbut-2-enyl diphosphate reductase [Streptomyces sp. NPDC020898]|uniref:4-hydroxy-3-methylbut-2-enyl diphosphate reductase n=1 Tax=Streptomyces sp. NPDC020898 TaxID=3365101 RepID=UPI0037B7D5AB